MVQAVSIGSTIAGTFSSLLSFSLTWLFHGDSSSEGGLWFSWLNFGTGLVVVVAAAWCWATCQQSSDYFQYYHDQLHYDQEHCREENEQDRKQGSRLIDVLLDISDLVTFAFISNIALMIFWPFIPANTRSVNDGSPTQRWWQGYMFRPLAFMCSALSSLIGKLLPSVPGFYTENLPFVAFALGRCLLIIVYMMGNVQIAGRKLIVQPLLASDSLYFIILTSSAILFGYLSTVASMAAPNRVRPVDRATASNLMVFFSHYGDLVGILVSTVTAVLMKTVLSVPVIAVNGRNDEL